MNLREVLIWVKDYLLKNLVVLTHKYKLSTYLANEVYFKLIFLLYIYIFYL